MPGNDLSIEIFDFQDEKQAAKQKDIMAEAASPTKFSFPQTLKLLKQLKLQPDKIYGHTIVNEDEKRTLLHDVCYEGKTNVLKELLQQSCDVKIGEICQFSPLHRAAQQGKIECLKLLIAAGADVNCKDSFMRTPLYYAAHFNHLDCLNELLLHKTVVNAQDDLGYTPLHLAAEPGHLDCIKALIAAGADPRATNNFNQTALLLTLSNPQCVEYLKTAML